MSNKSFSFSILLLLISLLSACVTTNSRNGPVVNKQKAHDAHLNLGLTYLNRDSRESSRRHFEKALKLIPDSAPAHNGIAMLYHRTGEIALAEESFQRAVKEDSNYTPVHISYGRFLYEQKRYEEAYNSFEKASKDISYEQRALSLTYLGQTALQLNNPVKAKSSFQHAINLDNKLTLPVIELANVYFDEKNYAESKRLLDEYVATEGRTAKSLWLGIRIERIFGNKDKEASYALALKNLHPYSKEYLAYKKEQQKI